MRLWINWTLQNIAYWKHQVIQSLWKTLSHSLKRNTCKPYHLAVLLLAIYLTVICTQACVFSCSVMSHSLQLCSLPDSSVHGIFPARILEWVVISSSRGNLPDPGIKLASSALAGRFFTTRSPGKHVHQKSSSSVSTSQIQETPPISIDGRMDK